MKEDSVDTKEQPNNDNKIDEEEFKHTTLMVQPSQGDLKNKGYGIDGEKIYHEPNKNVVAEPENKFKNADDLIKL